MTFHLSTAQRSSNAKKAAATRKSRGIKTGFGTMSTASRSAAAKKAAATRKARGENNWRSHVRSAAGSTSSAGSTASRATKATTASHNARAKAAAPIKRKTLVGHNHRAAPKQAGMARRVTHRVGKGKVARVGNTLY